MICIVILDEQQKLQRSQGTVVRILTRRWDGLPGAPIPVKARYSSLLRNVHTGSRANPYPCSVDVRGILAGSKEVGAGN